MLLVPINVISVFTVAVVTLEVMDMVGACHVTVAVAVLDTPVVGLLIIASYVIVCGAWAVLSA